MALILISSVAGCQYSYQFQLEGVIKSSETGEVLTGVTFTVTVNDSPRGGDGKVVFDEGGRFEMPLVLPDIDFMRDRFPKVIVTASKPGYQDEAIDISPRTDPSESSEPRRIVIVAYLKPR